jgi:S-adenosylmethionine:tRNA ribosyltransferase-isomerase
MRTENLDYHLPPDLVAQHPCSVRSDSRLLVLDRATASLADTRFAGLGDFLCPGDCLVLNDTRVLPARFFARRATGGRIEGLFLDRTADGLWEVMLKGARRLRPGEQLTLKDRQKQDYTAAVVLEKTAGGRCLLELQDDADAQVVLARIGFPPLPPYIKRGDDPDLAATDSLRYQTVYARRAGAVAAPTAGLHFTKELIQQLRRAGVIFAYITLHVGAGTFRPVTAENLEDHRIHKERFSIDGENARLINSAKGAGGRIIPVGTTSTRVLETVAAAGQVRAAEGTTGLFITPGYKFSLADAMITNFHLPRSTLLALVAAFAGLEATLAAYKHAIEERYRFYSYGDAMLIV